jgi:hypothetical protein
LIVELLSAEHGFSICTQLTRRDRSVQDWIASAVTTPRLVALLNNIFILFIQTFFFEIIFENFAHQSGRVLVSRVPHYDGVLAVLLVVTATTVVVLLIDNRTAVRVNGHGRARA